MNTIDWINRVSGGFTKKCKDTSRISMESFQFFTTEMKGRLLIWHGLRYGTIWYVMYAHDYGCPGQIKCLKQVQESRTKLVDFTGMFKPQTAQVWATDIICSHDTGYHLYADDTELFLSYNCRTSPDARQESPNWLEACITNIQQCMPWNGLKLNDGKAEFLCLQSKHQNHPLPLSIMIGNGNICPSSWARDLGVMFDDSLSLSLHIKATCKSAFSTY